MKLKNGVHRFFKKATPFFSLDSALDDTISVKERALIGLFPEEKAGSASAKYADQHRGRMQVQSALVHEKTEKHNRCRARTSREVGISLGAALGGSERLYDDRKHS